MECYGELYDCALVLGTNALEALGFQILHPNGELVNATDKSAIVQTNQPESKPEEAVRVILDQKVRLGPFQSKVVKASISNASSNCDIHVGMIVPSDKLANRQCDFTEELWEEKSTGELLVTHWSREPLSLESGEVIGSVEQVSRVSPEDPTWSNAEVTVAQIKQLAAEEIAVRKSQLESQLVIGHSCSSEEQTKFKELLLSRHDSFATNDNENMELILAMPNQ